MTICAVFLLGVGSISAQTTMEMSISPLKMNHDMIMVDLIDDELGADVGSPYYNEAFLPSEVQSYPEEIALRYNAYTDEMEFEYNGVLHALLKEMYPEVIMGPRKKHYVYTPYENKEKAEFGFLVKLNENEQYPAYKKEWIFYIKPKRRESHYQDNSPGFYVQKPPKYYLYWNGRIREVPANKKKFAKKFGDKEKEVLNFIKTNKIEPRSDEGIILISEFLESLK